MAAHASVAAPPTAAAEQKKARIAGGALPKVRATEGHRASVVPSPARAASVRLAVRRVPMQMHAHSVLDIHVSFFHTKL